MLTHVRLCLFIIGLERRLLPPVVLVSSVGELFVQMGPTRVDVFSVLHPWNIPGMMMNHHPVSGGRVRRSMVGRFLTKEGSDTAFSVDVESSTDAGTHNNRLFGRLARKLGNKRRSKAAEASFTVNGTQLQKWEEVRRILRLFIIYSLHFSPILCLIYDLLDCVAEGNRGYNFGLS